MEALLRKRFLECLKTDVDCCTVDDLTYWMPGKILFIAYKGNHEGMRSLDRGKLTEHYELAS